MLVISVDKPQAMPRHDSDRPRPSPISSAAMVIAAVGLGLACVYLILGRQVAEKVATDLAMPLGLLATMLTITCVHVCRMRQPRLLCLLVATWLLVMISGNRLVANRLVRTLECRYGELDFSTQPEFDVALLLGGATDQTPTGSAQVNQNGDRIVMAARLYHGGLVSSIYCSGARTTAISKATKDESELSQALLSDLGVPASAVERIAGRNTSDEMREIAQRIGDRPIGVITSAWHLPRAMRLAESAGINAVPIPCGFLGDGVTEETQPGAIIRDYIPGHRALAINTRSAREYLAWIVSR